MGSTYTTLSFEPPKTNPKEAYLGQANATQNTWYTILNLSGSGYLHEVRATESDVGVWDNPTNVEIRFTIDGGTAQTSNFDQIALDYAQHFNKNRFELRFQRIRFFTSLKVEMRSTRAIPGTLYGKVFYSQV